MIFVRRFSSQGHTRQFCVEQDTVTGWAAREEEDNQVVKVTRARDWHRVERIIAMFDWKASMLQEQGWHEVGSTSHLSS
jgi:hypothetical protein